MRTCNCNIVCDNLYLHNFHQHVLHLEDLDKNLLECDSDEYVSILICWTQSSHNYLQHIAVRGALLEGKEIDHQGESELIVFEYL